MYFPALHTGCTTDWLPTTMCPSQTFARVSIINLCLLSFEIPVTQWHRLAFGIIGFVFCGWYGRFINEFWVELLVVAISIPRLYFSSVLALLRFILPLRRMQSSKRDCSNELSSRLCSRDGQQRQRLFVVKRLTKTQATKEASGLRAY